MGNLGGYHQGVLQWGWPDRCKRFRWCCFSHLEAHGDGAEARNANEKAAVLSIRQGRGEGLAVSTRPVTIVLCFVGQ